jgi:hypothetical protein
MVIQEENKHRIEENSTGFIIKSPLSSYTIFVSWNSIEKIIFSPNNNYEASAQWIIFLNRLPKWNLDPKAWWFSRFTFFLKNKKLKKLRMRDDMNKDFYEFPKLVEKYLKTKKEIDYDAEQFHRGELISSKVTVKDNHKITEEHWKPKRSTGLPWIILYDRYNRTIEEIYKRDGTI